MSARPLRAGKLPAPLLASLLAGAVAEDEDVLLPPGVGEDACAIRVPAGTLVAATDPVTMTGAGLGAHAVVINANDVAVLGVRPRWFLAVLLLPLAADEDLVRDLFEGMRGELDRLGATLVGGHTEVTPVVTQPVVIGQMLGLREDGGFVSTGGVRAGDAIVQVGPAPVEGAAVLAEEIGPSARGLSPQLLEAARRAVSDPGISVVEPALLCARLGATALHDPTEGGLSAGLHELAEASGMALFGLREDRMLWFDPGVALCEHVGADPWGTLASGALLASFDPKDADRALGALHAEGYAARIVAHSRPGQGVHLEGGRALPRYDRDELSRRVSGDPPTHA